MNATDIIQLAADLSVGLDTPTDLDKSLYLRYLNLVHFDVYKTVGVNNPYLPIIQETVSVTEGVGKLKGSPFIIKSVNYYESNSPKILKATSYDVILSSDPQEKETGSPRYWYYAGQALHIYPKATQEIHVVYMPSAKAFTLDTIEEEIPYPPLYHHVLADGICYYILQSDSGMRTKDEAKLALAKYDKGKKSLHGYLVALGGTSSIGSTFSVV